MLRGKKIVLVCHCILNSNSKVEGLATFSGALKDVVSDLIDGGIGIIQLPCPELTMLGIKRWGQTKEQYDNPFYRKHCQELFKPFKNQIQNYIANGYNIVAILGINGSPSCGVDKTCSGVWGGELSGNPNIDTMLEEASLTEGSGIFIEEIKNLLELDGIVIPVVGLDEDNIEESLKIVKRLLI